MLATIVTTSSFTLPSPWQAAEVKTFGPLRSPHGRVDALVHPDTLALRTRPGRLDLGEYSELLAVVGAIALAVVGAMLPPPFRYVCFGLALAVFAVLAVTMVVTYAAVAVMIVVGAFRLLTKDGRSRLRQSARDMKRRLDVGGSDVQRGDILWVSPIERPLLPRLRLGIPQGEVVLSAWPWRRSELEGLARELGDGVPR